MPDDANSRPHDARRVLIADDDGVIVEMLSSLVERAGATAVRAASGQEALRRLETESVDLLLTDVAMPGIDGFELIQRARRRLPRIKFAMMTGHLIDAHIRPVRDCGVRIVATKPFVIGEMSRTVRHALEPREAFGLRAHLEGEARIETVALASLRQYARIVERVADRAGLFAVRHDQVRIVLEELALNALYRGPRNPDGSQKYNFLADVELPEYEAPTVSHGHDHSCFGLAVRDPNGTLRAETVLERLAATVDGAAATRGRGRGLVLARGLADRLIINIDEGRRTEAVALFFFGDQPRTHKPLLINEVTG